MAVVSINELKSYFDKVGKKPTTSQYENLIDTLTTTTVGGLVSVTYAQMQSAILAGSINAGRIYKITDRGDLGLYFIGLSNTTLDFKNGARDMLVPLTYQTGTFGGFDWLGIWNAGLTPSMGNLVIWGGHVWRNLSGNLGAPVDQFTLDAEWELMSKSIGRYKVKTLGCNYDFDNDWIAYCWDENGNKFGTDYETGVNYLALAQSATNYCDWIDYMGTGAAAYGNECYYLCNNIGMVYNNTIKGAIYSNTNAGAIYNNSNSGNIYSNSNVGNISNNSNGGNIYSNSNVGNITNNSNAGNISGNSNGGSITNNSNAGEISNNSNAWSITNNSNSGNIYSNTNAGNISNNGNLGNIQSNTSQVVDISGNFNAGYITANSNTGNISNNGNLGNIYNNSNLGYIAKNYNSGYIENLTSVVLNVYNNINNGNILTSNFGDIFDTVVNK